MPDADADTPGAPRAVRCNPRQEPGVPRARCTIPARRHRATPPGPQWISRRLGWAVLAVLAPLCASGFAASRSSLLWHAGPGGSTPRWRREPTGTVRRSAPGGSDCGDGGSDTKLPEHLVVASSLSYLSSAEGKMQASPLFSGAAEAGTPLEPLVQVVDPDSESGATVFRSGIGGGSGAATATTLVVAFRGSATPVNFSTNLRFGLVPLRGEDGFATPGASGSDPSFRVHEGFRDASRGLWELLEPELDALLRREEEETGKGVRLWFTGHSLGSATAQLCAAKHQSRRLLCSSDSDSGNERTNPLAGVLTFGGPRLVNRALANHWNACLFGAEGDPSSSVVVTNYVHHRDPILRQNGPLWDSLGFGILGTEVLCEHDRPVAYESRDAGSSASGGAGLPLAWNILDHCRYLGVFVGPRLFG